MTRDAALVLVQAVPDDQDDGGTVRPATLWRRLRGQRLGILAGVVLLLLAVCALGAPFIAPYSPDHLDLLNTTAPPSWSHLFGTDDTGRDMLSRCLFGGRVSLSIGLFAMLIAMAVGIAIGSVAGFMGGVVDGIVMRLVDVLLALPGFFLLIVAATLFTPTIASISLILGLLSSTGTARLVRADILGLREREFVEAARALGVGRVRLITRHLLPNSVGTLTVRASLVLGYAILAESGLSYLGLGIQPPTPSWGNLLTDAQQYLQTAPWLVYPPGILIALTVVCVFLVGSALREVIDPQTR